MQIDVERHCKWPPIRSATHLDGFTAFVRHQFIMLKSLRRLFPFAPRRTGLSIGRNHWKELQSVPPDEKGAFTP